MLTTDSKTTRPIPGLLTGQSHSQQEAFRSQAGALRRGGGRHAEPWGRGGIWTHAAPSQFQSSTEGHQLHHLFFIISIKKNQNPSRPKPRQAPEPALPPRETPAGATCCLDRLFQVSKDYPRLGFGLTASWIWGSVAWQPEGTTVSWGAPSTA